MPYKMALLNKLMGRYCLSGFLRVDKQFRPQSVEAARQALQRIRSRYEFSQAETAALLGCGLSALRSWETGRRNPSAAVQRLITLTEQVLASFPPGKWIEEVYGFPLAQIIAWRKHECRLETLDEFGEAFKRSTLEEQEDMLRSCEKLGNWMKNVMERERWPVGKLDEPIERLAEGSVVT
jgi:transcriptional regulator with XRE-family HTH domain